MTDLRAELEDFLQGLQSPNILLIGRTGVGKSTLVNAVFGKNIAKAGAGLPVTQYFQKYSRPLEEGIPITLYDSAGFETDKAQDFLKGTFDFLNSQRTKGKEEQIHLSWYVVDASSARFEYFERELIDKLNSEKIPVIIVLSQCDRASDEEIDAIRRVIEGFKFEKAYDIIQVAASPLIKNGKPTCEPFGLEALVEKTAELLPKAYVDAFIAAQVVNIKAKRSVAWTYISSAAVICFASGYIPIPFTTPVTTLISQRELCFRLAALFGYKDLKGLPDILGKIRSSKEGRLTFWATTIADLFVGEPITSTIAGATAATFNCVVGLALASTFEELAKCELEGMNPEEIESLLQQIFKRKFDKYRSDIRIKKKEDLESIKGSYLEGS
jgi:predicted GTPase/uncharacterized protein (DUF697 family)